MNVDEERIKLSYEALQHTRKAFKVKLCLHPDASSSTCNGIINAHTIQRRGSLAHIAKDGHVICFRYKAPRLVKEIRVEPVRVGVGDASTFPGFCKYHDNLTFAPIDKNLNTIGLREAFLLGYRAICYEYHKKRAWVLGAPGLFEIVSKARAEVRLPWESHLLTYTQGSRVGLEDLKYNKQQFDHIMASGDYTKLRFYCVAFNDPPSVTVSGASLIDYDLNGKLIQDIEPECILMNGVALSIIKTAFGGAAVFTWVGDREPYPSLIRCLDAIKDSEVADAIVKYSFVHLENAYFNEEWWNTLSYIKKQEIARWAKCGYSSMPSISEMYANQRQSFRMVKWKAIGRTTNASI